MIARTDPALRTRAQLLADHVIARRDLKPPVPVEDLVAEFADIHPIDFGDEDGLDAVLYGYDRGDARPALLLNTNRAPRRVRFTLGHEYGHLCIATHFGTISCQSDPQDKITPDSIAQAIEREADEFASRLLVPHCFVSAMDLSRPADMLDQLQYADVSPEAGIYSLAGQLPPGYVFVVLNAAGTHIDHWSASHGTVSLGLSRGKRLEDRVLGPLLSDAGRVHHHGRRIWWGRVPTAMQPTTDTDQWEPILDRVLADSGLGNDRRPPSIGGKMLSVASSANSNVGHDDLPALIRRIHQQMQKHPELGPVLDHPELRDFITARARAFQTRAGRRR